MTPERIKRIRQYLGFRTRDMADMLRMRDDVTYRRWEKGEREITGPASVILQMAERGQLPQWVLDGEVEG